MLTNIKTHFRLQAKKKRLAAAKTLEKARESFGLQRESQLEREADRHLADACKFEGWIGECDEANACRRELESQVKALADEVDDLRGVLSEMRKTAGHVLRGVESV